MSAQPYHRVRLTLAEYLKFEELYPDRHELVDGEVRLMAGGSESHDLLTQLLNLRLAPDFMSRGCRVFTHNRKLRTADDNVYFPDLMIVCGKAPHRQYEEAPTWLFEVVSPGNTAHDLADKLAHYRAIPSLDGYVILDPDAGTVTLHQRHDLGWTTSDVTGGVLDLGAVQLDLVELYGDLARVVTAD